MLDLASPKLLAVQLARRWRSGHAGGRAGVGDRDLASARRGARGVEFLAADGGRFPSRTRASTTRTRSPCSSTSRATARRRRSRTRPRVRPGRAGARDAAVRRDDREDWRDAPMYAAHEPVDGRTSSSAGTTTRTSLSWSSPLSALELVSHEVVRMEPNWNAAYTRTFPWLLPLGPLYGLLGREVPVRAVTLSASPSSGGELPVDAVVRAAHASHVKRPPARAARPTSRSIERVEDARRRCPRLRAGRRPRRVAADLGQRRRVASRDRAAAGHRLDGGMPEALVEGREDERGGASGRGRRARRVETRPRALDARRAAAGRRGPRP